jgi:hypothetical protein
MCSRPRTARSSGTRGSRRIPRAARTRTAQPRARARWQRDAWRFSPGSPHTLTRPARPCAVFRVMQRSRQPGHSGRRLRQLGEPRRTEARARRPRRTLGGFRGKASPRSKRAANQRSKGSARPNRSNEPRPTESNPGEQEGSRCAPKTGRGASWTDTPAVLASRCSPTRSRSRGDHSRCHPVLRQPCLWAYPAPHRSHQ